MRDRDLSKLEYGKIKEKLREFVHSPATEELIQSLRPLREKEKLLEEIELYTSFSEVEVPLYPFEDVRGILKRSRIEGAVLSVEELLSLQRVLSLLREIRKVIGREAESKPPLRRLSRRLHSFSSLENLIEGSIDRRGFVKDSAGQELYRIRKSIKGVEREIMERLESLFRRPDAEKIFSDRIITLRNNRYVVPVKSSQVKKIFGIVHGTSSSGFTTYVEPQFVVELNNRLAELKDREEEETRRILRRITSYVADFSRKIEESFSALTEIDLLNAKRKLAQLYGGTFPKVGDHVELRSVRHPILQLMGGEVVPVDILLRERRGLILTGPNTGGKTVALKTLGLTVLLFQSAIPVPAGEGSVLRVFRDVFVDLGDEQSIEQSLSTFSSHMTNIAQFIDTADQESLVLLDELGAGTDPVEGSALGIGILEYLRERGAWIFANTHHTPVKMYAVSSDYFTPASVLFDRDTLRPLYRIAYNTVGESMAFEVAQRCGLPQKIIEIARARVGERGEELMSAVEKLTDYTHEYERKLSELEELRKELKREKERYEELYREFMELKRKGWKEAYREARSYLRKLVAEGQEILKKAKDPEDLRRFVEEQEKQLALFVPAEEIKVGDRVEFMGKRGKVLQIKNGRAYVALEGMRMWVDLKALTRAPEEAKKRDVPSGKAQPRGELNLIGMDANTALLELERFVEEAHAAGLTSVKIIHGVGTGVLRSVVHEFLSRCDRVKFFRSAYPKEGGAGVTIAFLKGTEEG